MEHILWPGSAWIHERSNLRIVRSGMMFDPIELGFGKRRRHAAMKTCFVGAVS